MTKSPADPSGNAEQANEQVSALIAHIPVLLEARYGNSQTNSAAAGKTAHGSTGQTTPTQKGQGVKSDPMLTLSKAGSGKGSFSSQKLPTLDCGADCQTAVMNVKAGTHVDVLATPDAGSRFAGWKGGNCAEPSSALCTFVLNQRVQLAAQFDDSADVGTGAGREVAQAAGSTGVVEVSAGGGHTLAIKPDGTLWAWGDNTNGQLGVGSASSYITSPILVGTGFAKVSAGYAHSLAIKTDGSLWAWGYNVSGQLGDGTITQRNTPVQIGTGYAAVSAGASHSTALRTDGSLMTWGSNAYGQLGIGTTTQQNQPTLISSGFQAVSAGRHHTLAIRTDGTLLAWGRNDYGQLGDGSTTQRVSPVQIGTGFSKVAAGAEHSIATKTDNSLWAWGRNADGQLGDGTNVIRTSPVPAGTGFVAVQAGYSYSLGLKADGTLWSWGINASGQLGDGTTTRRNAPMLVGSGFAAVAAGASHVMAFKSDRVIWMWGRNAVGQLGDGTTTNRLMPAPSQVGPTLSVTVNNGGKVTSAPAGVECGADCIGSYESGSQVTLTAKNTPTRVFTGWTGACSGTNPVCVLTMDAAKNVSADYISGSTTGFSTVSAGGSHGLALKADGSLWAWGDNDWGQLGDGTTTDRRTPVEVGTGFSAVSAGDGEWWIGSHSLGLKTDGSLWAWGSNYYGWLGDGTTTNRSTPVLVGSGFSAVSAGAHHSLALKTDGSLWAWGNNSSGQLGDGTTTDRRTPVLVGSGFSAVSAGVNHSLALKTNGSLWAWGNNEVGQLGDGTTTNRSTPVQVGTGFSTVSAGVGTLALKTDGSLWAWGSNYYGQLGDGTTTNRSTPVLVGSGFSAVSAGRDHSLALKTDGSLWAWGRNSVGQLGDGTRTNRSTPVQVGTGFSAMSAGYVSANQSSYSLALKTDGSLWAWGNNDHGQLGSDSGTERWTPSRSYAVTVTQSLTVTMPIPNLGTVSSVPPGLNCTASCTVPFMTYLEVELSAVPALGATFQGWGGACSGTGTCIVTMDAAKSVTANFSASAYTVSVEKTGPGTGTVTSAPAGINCGADCSEPLVNGSSVTLTATPSGNNVFTRWEGACTGKTSTCTLTVDAPKSVKARFDTPQSARPNITPILMLLLD